MGGELVGIDIDHHLAELAAEGVGDLYALEPAQFVADGVVADLVEFGFTEAFAADGRQEDGQVSGLGAHGERHLDAGRQMEEIAHLVVDDVVHGRAGIGTGLERDLDQTGAGQDAGLDGLPSSGQCQGPFHPRRHRLFHLAGRQSRIGVITHHHRLLEVGQDVGGDLGIDGESEKGQCQRRRQHGIGILEGVFYQHGVTGPPFAA